MEHSETAAEVKSSPVGGPVQLDQWTVASAWNTPNLDRAISAAQQEFGEAEKSSFNQYENYHYADLGSLYKATREFLHKHGLVVKQFPSSDVAKQTASVITIVSHPESGEWVRFHLELPASGSKGYNAKSVGATITFGRKYGYRTGTGLSDDSEEDVDKATGDKLPTPKQGPKVNQKPSQPTNNPRPDEKKSSESRTATGKTAETSQIENKSGQTQADPVVQTQADSADRPENGQEPYSKDEYLKEVAPKVKSYYDKASRDAILGFIKGETPEGKKTEEITRSQWKTIFEKLDKTYPEKK